MGPDTAIQAKGKASRIAPLDGLRGIAACGVAFLYHPLVEFNAEAVRGAAHGLLWFRSWGWTFVDLFFLISGYVFAQVYIGRGGIDRNRLPDFAIARLARLYPLHALMLLVNALLFAAAPVNTWYAFVAHVVMLQAFVAPVGHTFDGPSWSLSVEAVCYAIFAVAAASGDRVLRHVTAAVIALALGYIVVLGGPKSGPWAADCLPRGLLGFFLGQCLWRRRADVARMPTLCLVALLCLGLAIDMGTAWSPLPPLCLLAWPCGLALALRLPALGSRAFIWLGDRSYSIYLIHYPILLCFMSRLHVETDGCVAGGLTLAYVAIALAVSDLVYRHFEVPVRDMIRQAWQRHHKAPLPDGIAA